jgi:thiamine kinase-like enzyme
LEQIRSAVATVAERSDLLCPGDRATLRAALPRLGDLFRQIEAVGYPASLVHGDLNPENVRWTSKGWFIYDWTDACITHPFTDLALAVGAPQEPDSPVRVRVLDAFADAWRTVMPGEAVALARRAVEPLGCAFQVANYQTILDSVGRGDADESSGGQMLDLLVDWVRRLVTALR